MVFSTPSSSQSSPLTSENKVIPKIYITFTYFSFRHVNAKGRNKTKKMLLLKISLILCLRIIYDSACILHTYIHLCYTYFTTFNKTTGDSVTRRRHRLSSTKSSNYYSVKKKILENNMIISFLFNTLT